MGGWHIFEVVPIWVAVVNDEDSDFNISTINVGLLTLREVFCSCQQVDVFHDEECGVAGWTRFGWTGLVHCLLGKVFVREDVF